MSVDGRPLGDSAGIEGCSPGEGRPTGVPVDEPRGDTAAGWEGLVGDRSPATANGEA